MLLDFGLQMVWGPMLRLIAEALGESLDAVETVVEKRALERDVEVAGMGHFAKGTQGAFRFEVRGMVDGQARIVAEHVTRIGLTLAGTAASPQAWGWSAALDGLSAT